MSAFVSMTAHCARCHDHKFDPIPQEDYYSLQAVFAGVDRADRPYDADPEDLRGAPRAAGTAPRFERAVASAAGCRRERDQPGTEAARRDAERVESWISRRPRSPNCSRGSRSSRPTARRWCRRCSSRRHAERTARLTAELQDRRRGTGSSSASRSWSTRPRTSSTRRARSVSRSSRGRSRSCSAAAWRARASRWGRARSPACRRCPRDFAVDPATREGARRAALAHWITAPDNMLTWRSIVNRVWQYHFGAGIVDSANDFGHMGSHADASGTAGLAGGHVPRSAAARIKQLHKLIVMSADLSAAIRQQRRERARSIPRTAICGA